MALSVYQEGSTGLPSSHIVSTDGAFINPITVASVLDRQRDSIEYEFVFFINNNDTTTYYENIIINLLQVNNNPAVSALAYLTVDRKFYIAGQDDYKVDVAINNTINSKAIGSSIIYSGGFSTNQSLAVFNGIDVRFSYGYEAITDDAIWKTKGQALLLETIGNIYKANTAPIPIRCKAYIPTALVSTTSARLRDYRLSVEYASLGKVQ